MVSAGPDAGMLTTTAECSVCPLFLPLLCGPGMHFTVYCDDVDDDIPTDKIFQPFSTICHATNRFQFLELTLIASDLYIPGFSL